MKKATKGRKPAARLPVPLPSQTHPEATRFGEQIRGGINNLDALGEGYLREAIHHLSMAMHAREMIEREGMVLKTRNNYPMLHPAYRVLKESSALFARFMDLMNLDVIPPAPSGVGRPAGRK
jgi:hypothetical protein